MDTFQEHGYSSESMGPVQEHNCLRELLVHFKNMDTAQEHGYRNMITVQEHEYNSGTLVPELRYSIVGSAKRCRDCVLGLLLFG
jgi:hypothetical protein